MYSVIRLLITVLLLLVVNWIYLANKPQNLFKTSVVLFVAIFSLSHFLVFENYLITFSTPNDVWKYKYGSDSGVVILGEQSSIIFGDFMGEKVQTTAILSDKGWKIGDDRKLTMINSYYIQDIFVTVEQYSDKDLFMKVVHTDGESINLSDSYGTIFYELKDTERNSYYAFVPNYIEGYILHVDEEQVVLE